VNSHTQYITFTQGGPPPQVSIVGVQWIPPTLSFYLQNSGGSGYVTIAIFAGGYFGTFDFHVDAYASTSVNLNFSDYTGSAQPSVQVVDQRSDSSVTRTESSVQYTTETYTISFAKTDAFELRQTMTSTFEPVENPTPEPNSQGQTAVPWEYLTIPAVILGLVAAFVWGRRTREKEARRRGTRRKREPSLMDDDKTRVYD